MGEPKDKELRVVRRPELQARHRAGASLKGLLQAAGFTVQEGAEVGLSFQFEGGTYYLPPSEGDAGFYHLLYPNFWEIESDEEFGRALVACDAVNREAKLVKLHTAGADVWAGVESLHETPAAFMAHLNRYLGYVQEAVRAFRELMLSQAEDAGDEVADEVEDPDA